MRRMWGTEMFVVTWWSIILLGLLFVVVGVVILVVGVDHPSLNVRTVPGVPKEVMIVLWVVIGAGIAIVGLLARTRRSWADGFSRALDVVSTADIFWALVVFLVLTAGTAAVVVKLVASLLRDGRWPSSWELIGVGFWLALMAAWIVALALSERFRDVYLNPLRRIF